MRSTICTDVIDPDELERALAGDDGMSTAEYAVGLVFVVALVMVALAVVQSSQVFNAILKLFTSALKFLG